jgi:hypothetical protein
MDGSTVLAPATPDEESTNTPANVIAQLTASANQRLCNFTRTPRD